LNYANEIEMKLDTNVLKIGDTVYINKFGIDSNYIVTDIQETCQKRECEYTVKLQVANVIGNYIDVFRKENEQQEESQNYKMYVTHYNNDQISQTTEVII
jgi:3D (Asp-Asp-Asp) domain-containing protein